MKTVTKNPVWANSRSIFSGLMLITISLFFISCSSGGEENAEAGASAAAPAVVAEPVDDGKGIGPVKEVTLGEIDPALVEVGKAIYEAKCSACHRMDATKIVGPGLADVTERREPEWVMNMIINPEEMTKKDPIAKKLLAEHLTQMTNQNVTEADARALLEFFRQNDATN